MQNSVDTKPEAVMDRQVGSKQLSHEVRTSILDMYDDGVKQCDVAEYYKLHRSTVSKIIKRGRIQKSERRGRKKILSPRDTRKYMKVVGEQRFKPIPTITASYNQFAPVKVSARTIRRTLKSNGISNYVAASKSYRSSKDLRNRLIWANHRYKWGNVQWDKFVFRNESSFTIRPTTYKKRFWRKAKRNFNLHNLVPTFKSGYVTVSVWGSFRAHGKTPLVRINGTLKQGKYKQLLEGNIIPWAIQKYGSTSNFVFQQENCYHIEQSL